MNFFENSFTFIPPWNNFSINVRSQHKRWWIFGFTRAGVDDELRATGGRVIYIEMAAISRGIYGRHPRKRE